MPFVSNPQNVVHIYLPNCLLFELFLKAILEVFVQYLHVMQTRLLAFWLFRIPVVSQEVQLSWDTFVKFAGEKALEDEVVEEGAE